MKEQFVDSFLRAVQDVFALMLDLQAEKANEEKVEKIVTTDGANVTIGISGDLSGSVLFTFPEKTALAMVKIMAGMEIDKMDSFVVSALSEVANIISGNAVTNLNGYNFSCDLAPPQVVDAEDVSADREAVRLPVKTGIGKFSLNIALGADK
ncbi:MAG TPA: chemotaxis protein CheX [Firmicutes bacterium]|nr:chemotaxis protein CheX [Bacillota bacterium]